MSTRSRERSRTRQAAKKASVKKTETFSLPENVQVTYQVTENLKPWPNNPRKHSDKQLVLIESSIREYGFTAPIITDETGTILCGHGRWQVARKLGMPRVPTVILTGLTQKKKRAYVIADNRIAEKSSWDSDLLTLEIKTLLEGDYNVELTGFSTAEIDIMIDAPPKPEASNPDDLQPEDLNVKAVSCLGDMWILGHHRLLCGSALDRESYQALMGSELAQMVFTDPPYNVAVSGHVRTKKGHREFVMASGEMSKPEFTDFQKKFMGCLVAHSVDGSIHYICMDFRHMGELLQAAEPLYGPVKQLCVWRKNNGGQGSFYRGQHELVFVFKKGDAPHINNFGLGENGRYRTNVWDYAGVNTFKSARDEELSMHPTVKPVSLVADAIRDCSKRNGIILDPFCGSGTTIISAERTGRIARCIELDPLYIDVTIARWIRTTGKPVTHTQTGQTFEEVQAERLAAPARATAKKAVRHGR